MPRKHDAPVDPLLWVMRTLDAQASALFEGVERFARENALHG